MTLFQAGRSSPTRSIDFSGAQLKKRPGVASQLSPSNCTQKKMRRWAEPKAARFRLIERG
jgi:hypothetical protein